MINRQTVRSKSSAASAWAGGGLLQRKCAACGNHGSGGECSSCAKKKGSLQRSSIGSETASHVPSIVHDVLNSPGQPLDTSTRAFMEPRFRHDFSGVRVHTDERAAESARAVNASAYTVGNQIVFGTGQFQAEATAGRHLLAHELAHVTQQDGGSLQPSRISEPSDANEVAADALAGAVVNNQTLPVGAGASNASPAATALMRRVAARLTTCPPNARGAPADPLAELRTNDTRAHDIADQLRQNFADDARDAAAGIPASPSATFQSYQTHFGLPGPEGSGFLNRLTGRVRPTQAVALSEELNIVSRRFGLVARVFSQVMNYRCVEGEGDPFGGCSAGPCDEGDAWSCRGVDVIYLCPSFWSGYDSDGRAGILAHEALHIILGPSDPRKVGEIGDETFRGPGRNFNIAGCYEAITNDVFGITSNFSCPAPP